MALPGLNLQVDGTLLVGGIIKMINTYTLFLSPH